MRRLLSLIPLLLAACGGSSGAAAPAEVTGAQTDLPPDVPVPVAEDARGPFLWEVQGDRGPSYLFGTIHIGYDPYRRLPEVVWNALASSDVVVLEADLRAIEPDVVAELSALPEDESLREKLGPRAWERLLALLDGTVPASAVEGLRPWVVYTMVLQALHPTPIPLDKALMERAVEQGKELVFLEEWRAQLETLHDVTGVEDLRRLVASDSEVRQRLTGMVEAYRAGNYREVAELTLDPEEIAKDPGRYQKIFDHRNDAWAPRLARILNQRRAFVAVGVGHFPGKGGLLELLRDEGLLVQRVGAAEN